MLIVLILFFRSCDLKSGDVSIKIFWSLNFANQLLELDAFFSASGIITFKNSLDLQETFKNIPLDKLLVETDSPFLAPIPMRGKKNEPSFIKYTLEKLSILKEKTDQEMSDLTTKNFNKLFKL